MGKFLSALALVATLTACSTKIHGLRQSPSFSYVNLVNGKLVIGGVAESAGPLDEGTRSGYSALLRDALQENGKEYPVSSVEVVMEKLGLQYDRIVNELQQVGSLSDESLRTLRRALPDTRYVAFARIENNEVTTDRSETQDSEKIVATANRNVTASLNIYDLELAEIAWSGTVSKTMGSSRQYTREKERGFARVLTAIKGPYTSAAEQKYPYPPPPGTQQVLTKVFEGFGEHLPTRH
ncbi:hypothetical protein K2X33_02180 [bacterium]|nr:hypothetical protein [bacterium]